MKSALDTQVTNDARARRQQICNAWTTVQMDFFYGTGNEISVDIVVKAAMLRLLASEHKTLLDGNGWGCTIAVFLGLRARERWLDSFARVEIAHFRERLAELRRFEEQSKCRQIRRALQTFLGELWQIWQAESELQPFACIT